MVLKISKRGKTSSIEMSPDSKGILNKKFREVLGFEFN
jgi:hypothetical protein